MRVGRAFAAGALATAWLLSAGSALGQDSLPQVIRRTEPSTVQILTLDRAGRRLLQGSGFVIGGGDVVTCRHVLAGASKALVKTADGKVHPVARVLSEDKSADLARLSVAYGTTPPPPLDVAAALPEPGEELVVIGSPLGLEQSVTSGIVSAVRDLRQVGQVIQTTAPMSPGSSGSPVVNRRGEVVGVATFLMVEGQNVNFAVPGSRVLALGASPGMPLAEWSGAGEPRRNGPSELYATGRYFLSQGNFQKALPHFEEASRKDVSFADAYLGMGTCLEGLGRLKEAAEAFELAITLKPEENDAYLGLGSALTASGRYAEAVEAFQQAVRLKPDDALAYDNMGTALTNMGRHEEACIAYQEAIKLRPDLFSPYNNLGVEFCTLKRYPESAEALKRAIQIEPDNARAHYNLGYTFSQARKYREAMESYKVAIRLKPDDPAAHYGLGRAVLALGDRGMALEEYKILKGLNRELADDLFGRIYH